MHHTRSGAAAKAACWVLFLSASVFAAPVAAPRDEIVTCLIQDGRDPVHGPCSRPETLQLIPVADGPPTLLTNFGLVFAATDIGTERPKYELVCDDYLGGKPPARVAQLPDGQLLVPGVNGLFATGAGTLGCGLRLAEGSLATRPVADVAVAPAAGANVPVGQTAVWALGADIDGAPRSLHLSGDGGARFAVKQPLPAGVFTKILVAPSDPRTLYVAGYRGQVPLVLLESTDAADTLTTRTAGSEVFMRPTTEVDVLGVHPDQPRLLLLAAYNPAAADEIWRSSDGGASWTKQFTLRGTERVSAFLWRKLADGRDEVLIGGRAVFRQAGQPDAHLYRSRDGGLGFDEVIPSGDTGPRYRCLAAQGDRLFACAGDEGDAFMTGYSDDGGRSWTALAQLTDIVGSRPCAAGRCLTTAIWLCEVYGSACAGLAPPDRRAGVADAAAGDACVGPDCGGGGNGCGCALGGWPAASPVWLMAGLFLLAWRWRPGWARRRAA